MWTCVGGLEGRCSKVVMNGLFMLERSCVHCDRASVARIEVLTGFPNISFIFAPIHSLDMRDVVTLKGEICNLWLWHVVMFIIM